MVPNYIHKFYLTIGFLSLFHAAYSAAQHRSFLRLNNLEFVSLPLDIIIQALISLFIVMYGILHIAGNFKEIKATAELENTSWDTFSNLPSFYTFNNRCKLLTHFYNYKPTKDIFLVE